jgi:type IV secretory pathway VirB2 component (pilin)|tara:strand:+ start:1134 stop:1325 length:192 start_codon:yes stop_codon:yes gene_type:complete
MSELVSSVMGNYMQILAAAASIVGGFAVIASLTPNKSDDRIVQMILDVVNFLGANFGKAKNDK